MKIGASHQYLSWNFKADDENDHDSLNQSGAEGAEGQESTGHIPGLASGNGTDAGGNGASGVTESFAAAVTGSAVEQQLLLQQQSTNSSTPVVRPTTPVGMLKLYSIGDNDEPAFRSSVTCNQSFLFEL